MILHYFSSAGWQEWGLPERPLIREAMPVLIDEDLRFEDAAGPRPAARAGSGLRARGAGQPLFGFPELRDWLLSAGFTTVTGHGEDGRPLTADHKRMVIVADLP